MDDFQVQTSAMAAPGVVMVMMSVLLVLCLATSELHLSAQDDVNRVACPGCQWACDSDETCCQTRSGDWGCCFLPNVS